MKKEVIMVIKDNQRLIEINEEIDRRGKEMGERMYFLKKQMQNISSETKKSCLPLWDEVEKIAKDSGKLPNEYNRQEYFLSLENGALIMKDMASGRSISEFLHSILGI